MNAKQILLKRIEEQIKQLQATLEANKNLPDSVFEGLNFSNQVNSLNMPSAEVFKPSDISIYKNTRHTDKSYGANKRTIVKILEENNKAMQKGAIVEMFADISKISLPSATKAVTNAMSALKEEGIIIGYKPAGLKFKGFYWGLKDWFKGGNIELRYEPYGHKITML